MGHSEETDTTALLVRGRDKLILSFRGTNSIRNLTTDFRMDQVNIPEEWMITLNQTKEKKKEKEKERKREKKKSNKNKTKNTKTNNNSNNNNNNKKKNKKNQNRSIML